MTGWHVANPVFTSPAASSSFREPADYNHPSLVRLGRGGAPALLSEELSADNSTNSSVVVAEPVVCEGGGVGTVGLPDHICSHKAQEL